MGNIAFSWYGGKYSHLDWLLPLLPKTNAYCEPFGGSAAVLLNKEPCGVETYNDLDGEIVNFFNVLRNKKDELITILELSPYSREEFANAIVDNKELTDVEMARRFYIKARQSFNSSVGALSQGDWAFSKTDRTGNKSKRVSSWLNSFDKLEAVALRLRMVQLENDYAIPVIKRYDSEETLFYCDPPYPFESRTRDTQKYAHEMTEAEHRELAECLREVKGMVALSGYQCELMNELYGDWNRHDVEAKLLPSSSGAIKRSESLWTNYDPRDYTINQIKLI